MAIFNKKKSGYDRFKNNKNREYDPHNNQRTKRSHIEDPLSVVPGMILAAIGSFVIASLVIAAVQTANLLRINGISSLFNGVVGWYWTQHFGGVFLPHSPALFLLFLAIGLILFAIFGTLVRHSVNIENEGRDLSDINQHEDDAHLMFPEEMDRLYNVFPDRGAHSSVQVSGIISHRAVMNKGVHPVDMAMHNDTGKPMVNDDGEIAYYPGEILRDENDDPIYDRVPMFDEDEAKEVVLASLRTSDPDAELPKDLFLDPTKTPYNPGGKNRDKAKYETLADLINNDWYIPDYEVHKPTGVYYVSSDPINTLAVAITRAGKGQTQIEPTIDMWTREARPNNALINDPKGENARRFYAPCAIRGIDPVLINLMVPMKTDIYNPIHLAVEYSRKGIMNQTAAIVTAIADVFFPKDGGEDPVWPAAASNAFQRAVYGMIDYYMEKERNIRAKARAEHWTAAKLDRTLDVEWAHVSLYNCYQFFVRMTAKKLPNPAARLKQLRVSHGLGEDHLTDDEFNRLCEHISTQSEIWDGKPEADMLELFFNATERLPMNSSRRLVTNANNSLKGMGVAEKMLGSVYGIAITGMSYFTDPTVSTLTSGRPSQNLNLESLSFPRHLSVRFDPEYIAMNKYLGCIVKWDAYTDSSYEKTLGKDFHHENIITQDCWAHYYFDGKFDEDMVYLKLSIYSSETKRRLKSFKFRFVRGYQMSLNYMNYITNPITEEPIVKDGTLSEIGFDKAKNKYRPITSYFNAKRGTDVLEEYVTVRKPIFMMTDVQYTERPKFIFVITPPHLMQYAKLILIMIKQLTDLNFGSSYTTMENQKPLYKTRYMLDELGNLQSEGKGIMNFQTLLSIGLGQDQQFTLILQTLQQLKDVYGETANKTIEGNTANIVYLKSTDDELIDNLSNRTGIVHRSYQNGKSLTEDMARFGKKKDSVITRNYGLEQENVIPKNAFMSMPMANSILLSAGNSTIWNRDKTIMPMSWRLLWKGGLTKNGEEYAINTMPTTSTAKEFNLAQNVPKFEDMLKERIAQATIMEEATQQYMERMCLAEDDLQYIDPDTVAGEIMDVANELVKEETNIIDSIERTIREGRDWKEPMQKAENGDHGSYEDSEGVMHSINAGGTRAEKAKDEKHYLGGTVSERMLDCWRNDSVFDAILSQCFSAICKDDRFKINPNGSIELENYGTIAVATNTDELDAYLAAYKDPNKRVYADSADDIRAANANLKCADGFIYALKKLSLAQLKGLAGGTIYNEIMREINNAS